MEFEDIDYSPLEGELAAIVRAMLCRHGGRITIPANEMPVGLYTLDVEHTEDGGVCVTLLDHGSRIQ